VSAVIGADGIDEITRIDGRSQPQPRPAVHVRRLRDWQIGRPALRMVVKKARNRRVLCADIGDKVAHQQPGPQRVGARLGEADQQAGRLSLRPRHPATGADAKPAMTGLA
jgi:hypothetical protein